jgi:hypothetical protein
LSTPDNIDPPGRACYNRDVYDYDAYDPYEDEYEEEERYWTIRRVIFLLVTLLIVVAFLTYTLLPLIQATVQPTAPDPGPTPTAMPLL